MTTQKKYELLQNDTINHNGRTLYRIKAITTFGTVFAGTLGGYIEKESNLKHLGNAWVYDNAKVYDSAEVWGSAKVRSFAVLSERKMIFWASNVGTENGTLTVYNGKDGLLVTRGCFTGTVEEFLAKSDEVHDEKTKREYQLLIEVAKSRILGEAT
ncbi:hypothetical protein P2G45_13975 [Mannheimia haemolytica]|nr:hypothetical protein [Mannheimia haemolytica]MDW0369696.1 hypothetical protein [Mannheimia haemolytica]MDW0377443.1 hypothetical protein [Mannheimia haemolytica]MDW0382730.1 hypothetical protein [Mannheimia haemolytica]MDW0385479.1 hypothetical protein [Mannheimia haemolytica]